MSIPVDFIIQARDATSNAFRNVSARLTQLQNKYSAFGKISKGMLVGGAAGVAGVAAVGAMTAALVNQTMAINDTLGNLQDLRDKYKVTTDFLQVAGRVAGDAGVEIETVAKGMAKLQDNIAKARNGGKEIDLFASVGVKGKDINKSAEEIFAQVSDIFAKKSKSGDDMQKLLAAKALFGKAGIELMPLLETGSTQLHEIMLQMRKDGTIISKEQIKAADDTGDAFGYAQARLTSVKNRAFLELNPAIDAITESITKMLNSGGSNRLQNSFKMIGEQIKKIAPKFIEKIPVFFEWLSNIDYGVIISSFKSIGSALGSIFSAINKVGQLVGWDNLIFGGVALFLAPAALALAAVIPTIYAVGTALFFAFAANPALLAITLLATAALLIYRNWEPISAFFVETFESIVGAVSRGFGVVIPIIKNVGASIFNFFTAPLRIAINTVNLLIQGMNKVSGLKIPQIQQIPTGGQMVGNSPAVSPRVAGAATAKVEVKLTTEKGINAVATPAKGGVPVKVINKGQMTR